MKQGTIAFIIGFFAGMGALLMWQQPEEITEAPAVAIAQPDGSQVLERRPDAGAKSPSKIPKGGKVERIIHGEIKPTEPNCPLCKFDLTLVRMPDSTMRVVLWSDTGTVLGGLDVPTVPLEVERKHPWAAGISRGTGTESWGGWLDKDFGPVRIGGEANKTGDNKYEARFKMGLVF